MAYPYTRSRARSELADSDVEPSDTAPSAAPLPPSMFVGPNVMAAEGPESVSTESAGPVSAPTLSLPAGSHSSLGSWVSALGYPSGLADPPNSSAHSGGQTSLSLATGIPETAQLEQSSSSISSYSQQPPPATAADQTAAAEGPTLAPQ